MKTRSLIILFYAALSLLFLRDWGYSMDETQKRISWPNNSQLKIEFLKTNFQVNRYYKVKDDIELFKKIMEGNWYGPPHSEYSFEGNGKFNMVNYEFDRRKELGIWSIKDNNILLKFGNEKIWKSYEVEHYGLMTKEDDPSTFNFVIKFKGMFYQADVLFIEFKK